MDFRIRPKEGYNGRIGELISMMEYSRDVLLEDISGLSQFELDYLPDEDSNSIGALLMHIASIDFVHQIISFEDRDINDLEAQKWGAALELGSKARAEIKCKPLEYYLEILSSTREKTLSLLKSVDENWLFEEKKWDNGVPHNHYWLWYHVMEDEINHRGQIRILKRMLKKTMA